MHCKSKKAPYVAKFDKSLTYGCVNYEVASELGSVLSSKMATLHELNTVYSLDDVYVMYDIIAVDNYNSCIINNNQIKKMERMNNV